MTPKTYDQRLDGLLSTAAGVFAAKGYHPTTMRDLSRETGMSLAGMYHYVRGKDELLALVQERCFSQVLEGAQAAVEAARDPADRLQRFIRHHVTFFAEHMPEMKVLSHEAESLSPERSETIDGLKRRYADLLLGLLEEAGIAAGGSSGRKVAAYALFGMMNWIYTWYDPQGSIRPDALAEQFTQLFLRGVAPERAAGAVITQNQRG
jgi:AcrR family transcriptional regulator